ncbi:uncharacterized protein [Rutidosis leptorrhynchoides]|uniref:uncharacterized protein n=1 Tax=Rutidosis leptorrhynchoides TaxID=125765 RepID=UPI003A98D877
MQKWATECKKGAAGIQFTWEWHRIIYGRSQNELEQIQCLLQSALLGTSEIDRWKWQWDSSGTFKSSEMAARIDEKILGNSFQAHETTRNNLVPKKIEVFVWRTIRKRIPTRVELDNKHIDLDSVRCPVCDDGLETVEHTLVFCKMASEIWKRILAWWKFDNINAYSIDEIFKDTSPYSNSSKMGKIWQAVKWISGYLIWKNRNSIVFGSHSSSSSRLVDEIQCKSYEWICTRTKKINLDWRIWLSTPVASDPRVGVG